MSLPGKTSCLPSRKESNGGFASEISPFSIRNNLRKFATPNGKFVGEIMADIEAHESKLYAEFAPLYDNVFGKTCYNRLETVTENLGIPQATKALKVGAGPGTSLPAYPLPRGTTGA